VPISQDLSHKGLEGHKGKSDEMFPAKNFISHDTGAPPGLR
jgi:hypothetical protein